MMTFSNGDRLSFGPITYTSSNRSVFAVISTPLNPYTSQNFHLWIFGGENDRGLISGFIGYQYQFSGFEISTTTFPGAVNVPVGYIGGTTGVLTNAGTYSNPWVFTYHKGSSANLYGINGTSYSTACNLGVGSLTDYFGSTGSGNTFYICEFIHYDYDLSVAQRQTVEGYLANKWNLRSFLSNTHPHFSIAPRITLPLALGQVPLTPGQMITGTVRTFTYTGANQSYTVPGNTTSLLIHMWGAGGGGGSLSRGGAGAYLTGILNVFPGELLTIIVGQGGRGISQSAANSGTTSAYGGGGAVLTNGNGNSYGNGGGGGRSAIQRASADIVTVGAGGGTGVASGPGYTYFSGGAGSYNGAGSDGTGFTTTQAGKGGTLTAGGAAGPNTPTYNNNATPGSKNQGGTADAWSGGGGSGYYGGGGASDNGGYGSGGGGGGSSYIDNLTSVGGANSTDGYSAPGTSVSFYQAGVAVGAYVGTASTATNGGNGLVVVIPVSAAVPPALQNILAPPLTPLSVSGCQLWLDGADPAGTGTAPANGATVSTWVDKSGNGRNATAVVAGVYSSAQKSITFSGTNYYNSPYTAAPTTETLFIIFNLITNNGGFMISGAACGGRAAAMYSTDGRFAGGANCYTWGAISSSITTGSNTLGVVVTDGSSNYTSLHGALTLTGPTTGITYTSGVTTYIGAHSGPNYLTNGYICEVIAYNSILTVLQRQKVEGYLGWKWGLQTNLPPTHPYFSASPTIPITIAMTQPYPPALTRIFSYTGADQSYIVPSGYRSVTVYMWGAGGGGGYTGTGSLYGGAGAYLQGVLTVTPGATLTIIVGGGGVYRENIGGNTTSSYGGGGTAGAASGSGGGRSAIRVSGASDDLVTVGSGGGASYINTDNCYGGNGDSVTGTGGDSGISGIYYGGKGGTQSAGGIVGSGNSGSGGTAGSKYTGGNANVSAQSGGGGGSGYYGGGGGGYYTPGSGGGGGSSFTANLTSIVAINSPDRSTAPNTASPYYQTGVASGGATGLGGGNGLVVIVPNAPSLPFPTKVYTVSFTYTGSLQDFILPFGAYPATVYMWGAGGGYGDPGGASGGAGAYVTGKVSFVQGQTYKILVGGGAGYTTGGYGGGGNTGWGGSSGGGGRSAIQQPLGGILSSASGNGSVVTYTTSSSHGLVVGQPVIITGLTPSGYNGTFVVSTAPSLTTFTVSNTTSGASSGSGSILAELVDAGGGGGAATWTSTAGGGAAAYIGTASNGQSPGNNVQGLGGSQTAGGAAVSGGEGTGSAGGPLQGGSASGQGGGGGGGYYGGGGGASASYNHGGGGGGSSYTALLTNVSGANGSGGTAPGTTVTGYIAGVAAGGITSSRTGGNGLVIISYIGF
jgi:hypothetical protein